VAAGDVLRRVSRWLERRVMGERRWLASTAATKRMDAIDAKAGALLANPALRAIDAEQRVAMRDLRASARELTKSLFPGPEDEQP
jgi:hypothetical protein